MSAQRTQPPNPNLSILSDRRPNIVRNPDGTYTRLLEFPATASRPDHDGHSAALSKDVPLNPQNKTWLRIHLPSQALYSSPPQKLPLIVYFHGGGFVFMGAATPMIHDFCDKLASRLAAVVVSVNYRLAPEHRLPAAYDDAKEALLWTATAQDQWLSQFADVSNCFIMGTSAGGNIAYHAGLRGALELENLKPLKITGLILHHPFFGGSERTASERGSVRDPILTLSGTDYCWEMALPTGADRDHEYSNPTAGDVSGQLEPVRDAGFRVLITGRYDDPLIDRQMQLAGVMKEKGLTTAAHFGEGYHSVELHDESKAEELFGVLENFISFSED
ncbi:carboxylesterase 1-like [Diospyros lotus]|uniref:carboxylesterase 1-like n=1 Tax=Diospyros lotus TaxID=55363 RepID=UPI002256F461|nr:carboxylesterase 1-like [Diospyros lotus]